MALLGPRAARCSHHAAVFVYAGEIPCVTLPAGEAVDLSGILRDGALLGTLEHDGEAAIDVAG